ELVVAAQRVVLGERHRVVGVITVGGSRGGHHQTAHTVRQCGIDHVAGTDDIDGVFLLGGGVASGVDDRCQVYDDVGAVGGDEFGDAATVPDVGDLVGDRLVGPVRHMEIGADH